MTKKIGPLKVWHWASIVGGGLGLYLLLHKKKAGSGEGESGTERLMGKDGITPGGGAEGGASPSAPLFGEPGLVGEPGVAGTEGKAAELSETDRAILTRAAAALNNPPAAQSAQAPKAVKLRPSAAKLKPKKHVKPLTRKHAHETTRAGGKARSKALHRVTQMHVTHHTPTGGGGRAPSHHGPPSKPKILPWYNKGPYYPTLTGHVGPVAVIARGGGLGGAPAATPSRAAQAAAGIVPYQTARVNVGGVAKPQPHPFAPPPPAKKRRR